MKVNNILFLLKKADLPLEVVILVIAGMTLLIAGVLLFPVSSGVLPYYENGLYGLLLVIFALQIITMGKTPFGDMRRSKTLLFAGVTISAAGIITCFIPGIFDQLPRLLLFICFGPGGVMLLLNMCFEKNKLRAWISYGGIFRHLIAACSMVYGMSILIALLLWKQHLLTTPGIAVAMLFYSAAIGYLAFVLRKIYRTFPEAEKTKQGEVVFSIDQAMMLMMGVFMLLLGLLLIPVNLGRLPFSGSAQLGLLMVIFSVQMLASGNTPVGPFPRTWLIILTGFLFAAPGIVSCIIPGILVSQLTVLIGVLNILGGVIGLQKICTPLIKKGPGPHHPAPPVMVRLFSSQLTLNLLTILFGASMLFSHLIPGLVLGAVLASNGAVLLYLLYLLVRL